MKTRLLMGICVASSLLAQKQAIITPPGAPETVYQTVLKQLKTDGLELDSASLDAGIQTSLVITGKLRHTGTYSKLSFIPAGNRTEIRIAVYEEKRLKALKIDPWSEPKLQQERSEGMAFRLKQELGW